MSFRSRLFFSFVVLAAVLVGGSVLMVNYQFGDLVQRDVLNELAHSPERFDAFLASQMDILITQAVNISTSPTLRGTMSTMDRPTIMQAAEETNVLYGYDLFWVLDTRGTVVHRVDEPHHWGDSIDHLPLIQDVANGYDSGDIWLKDGMLYQVAATQVRSGDQWLGSIVIGVRFDTGINAEFAELTHLDVAFATVDTIGIASLSDISGFPLRTIYYEKRDELARDKRSVPSVPWQMTGPDSRMPNAPTFEFRNAGIHYAGALFRLNDVKHDQLAYAMVFQPLTNVRELQQRIRNGLVAVGVGAMFLSLLVAYLLSRGLARPINRLVSASQRLGRGDLETPVPVSSNDEIGVLARALEEMRVSLRDARAEALRNERLTTIGRMASTITHDFRQPITSIYGYIQLITLPSADREMQQEFAQQIIKQIDRMQGMINELLDYSRGEYVLNKQEVQLSTFLERVRQNFDLSASKQHIELVLKQDWDGTVQIDSGRFERVLDNLIRNAMQAIKNDGLIKLSVARDGDTIAIEVQDTGPGIPEEIRENLFDAFVTHGKAGGTGLGLAVTKKVVEEHGGTISVASEVGSGTTFTIRIPVTPTTEA